MVNHKKEVLLSYQLSLSKLQSQYFKIKNMRGVAINESIESEKLPIALNKAKHALMSDKKNLLIEKIKVIIIEMIYYSEKQIQVNFSHYLSQKLDYNYTYMANLFSKVHGSSIQNFLISTKIERVKELLIYENITLTQIALKLNYSSVAHLSNQFKKVTALSPTQFLASTMHRASLLPHNSPRVFHTDSSENESVTLPFATSQTIDNCEKNFQQMEG